MAKQMVYSLEFKTIRRGIFPWKMLYFEGDIVLMGKTLGKRQTKLTCDAKESGVLGGGLMVLCFL